MNDIVVCELRIKNSYKSDYITISAWLDNDKTVLIKKANKLLNEIVGINFDTQIEYTEERDNAFGGRIFFTATIVVGRY